MNTSMQVYSNSKDVTEMAKRFRIGVKGGDKLSAAELQNLAETALVTNLNPYIGEIWAIPGKGTMIGIAGSRRLWQEQSIKGGGFSFVEIIACSPQEAGATEADVVIAFKAIAHDSKATREYQKVFIEMLTALRASGSTDPVKEARDIVGPKPEWIGYGYSTKSETSRMNKTQLARKRAEADALKKCVVIPFGVNIAAAANAEEYTNGEIIEEHNSSDIPMNGSPRPYAPPALKNKLAEYALKFTAEKKPLKGNEAQVIVINLDECFLGDKEKRHALMFYLTHHESEKDLDAGWLQAVKKWINPTQDSGGSWKMDAVAIKEAHAVYEYAMIEQGQIKMEIS